MPDDHQPDEAPFSSESDSVNDAASAEAIEDAASPEQERKPAGALKFLTVVMLLLAAALVAGPFLWGLEDLKKIKPDSSVLTPWLEWLGDLHILILHIPIGIFALVLTMEIFGLLSFRKFKPHLGGALALNSFFAIVACVFGYFLFLEGDHGNASLVWDLENNLMGMHMWLSILFAVFVIFSFISKMWSRHHDRFSPFYPVFMLFAATSLTIGAHMGGEMVHKDKDIVGDFLILADGGTPGVAEEDILQVADVTDIPPEERLVYAEVVKPILQGKCWECHAVAELNPLGKKKIKGGLEMTSVELLLKGGKNADVTPTLVPGDAGLSEMMVRVHLDVDDDEFMPKGKDDEPEAHLTEGEVRILEWWINHGSLETGVIDEANDIPLKEAEGYEAILSDVAAFVPVQLPEVEKVEEKMAVEDKKEVEDEKASAEEEKAAARKSREALVALKQKVDAQFPNSLTFASANSNEMHFNAATFGKDFDDSSLEVLKPVADSVVHLDLKKTEVTDEGMRTISQFGNLRRLMLNETPVSDEGVKALAGLPALESLSLFDTQVGDDGISALRETSSLKSLYLSRTGASQKAVDELKEALPNTKIVYQPTLIEPAVPLQDEKEEKVVPLLPVEKTKPKAEPRKPAVAVPDPPLPEKPAIGQPAPAPKEELPPVVPAKPEDAQLKKEPLTKLPLEEEKAPEPKEIVPEKKNAPEKKKVETEETPKPTPPREEVKPAVPKPKPAEKKPEVTPPAQKEAVEEEKKDAPAEKKEATAKPSESKPDKTAPKPAKEEKPAPEKPAPTPEPKKQELKKEEKSKVTEKKLEKETAPPAKVQDTPQVAPNPTPKKKPNPAPEPESKPAPKKEPKPALEEEQESIKKEVGENAEEDEISRKALEALEKLREAAKEE